MQTAWAVLYCHLWSIWLYHMFPHYLINGTIFRKKKELHKMCFLIFSANFVWNISHSKTNSASYYHKCTYIGLHVKYRLFLSNLNETWFSQQIFQKHKDIRFNENPPVKPNSSTRTHTDRDTDMTKATVDFLNFVNAPKILKCMYIQGVPGGMCQTSGGCFLC
jgi:hypothetical protein